MALAVSSDGRREPLGVAGERTWVRSAESPTRKRKEKKLAYRDTVEMQKESDRWGELVDEVEQRIGDTAAVVHVMDSEADDYALLAKLHGDRRQFVIRMCYDRVLADGAGERREQKTREFVKSLEISCFREARISRRKPTARPEASDPSARTQRTLGLFSDVAQRPPSDITTQ